MVPTLAGARSLFPALGSMAPSPILGWGGGAWLLVFILGGYGFYSPLLESITLDFHAYGA